jgi:hypothetical protein
VYDERRVVVENAIGMKSPRREAVVFESFETAKLATEGLLANLPNPEYGFSLYIFGIQGTLEGLYFQRDRRPKYKKVKNGEGEFDYDILPTGDFNDDTVYMHDVPASPKKHWQEMIEES